MTKQKSGTGYRRCAGCCRACVRIIAKRMAKRLASVTIPQSRDHMREWTLRIAGEAAANELHVAGEENFHDAEARGQCDAGQTEIPF